MKRVRAIFAFGLATVVTTAAAAASLGTWGFDESAMDRSVKPGDDFFSYANGRWMASTPIPPNEMYVSAKGSQLDLVKAEVQEIVEADAANSASPSTTDGKIGAAYRSFMDEAEIERRGTKPLEPDLDAVRAVKERVQMDSLMGRASASNFSSVVTFGIYSDAKDPRIQQLYVSQGGLGMDRANYLDPQFATKLTAYREYAAKLLELIGWPQAGHEADALVDFETRIAQVSWTETEQRDFEKSYSPTTVDALTKMAPGLDWRALFEGAGLGARSDVVLSTSTSLPKIAAIYAETPIDVLQAWQAFHVIDSAAEWLPKPFADSHFAFRDQALTGQQVPKPRKERAKDAVEAELGWAVGEAYVARYFPASSKAALEKIVAGLKAAFARRIESLDWMSAETKREALAKLAKLDVGVGYPNHWRNYAELVIRPDDAYGNAERGLAFEWARLVRQLGKPVDRDEWGFTPQTIQAYNQPYFNQVVFLAALLQPPTFDPKADPAVNYGDIGSIIGHEITHGFDDQGRKLDANGALRDWWRPEDAKRFQDKAHELGGQYATFEPFPGVHVNADLTMGENIADLGGVSLALDAYHDSLHGKPAPVIDGFTGDQRFFLGWAQNWRRKFREDVARQQLASDPHSPADARVNGVVRNIDAWYAAFGVEPGNHLYLAPAERVHIW